MLPNTINLLENKYNIILSEKRFLKPKAFLEKNNIYVFLDENKTKSAKEILVNFLKSYSKKIIELRVKFFSKEFDFKYNRISIKAQSSRWGSCSSRGNLNFNYKLIFTNLKVLDYVIVHELAHTKEMNHSARFWKIVEDILPEYKIARKYLRANQLEIIKILN